MKTTGLLSIRPHWRLILGVILFILVTCLQALAQPLPMPIPSPSDATNAASGNFLYSIKDWFTSSDTNATTFETDHVDVWAGVDYEQGVNVSASLGIQAPVYKHWLMLESVTRNAGIAGTIVSEQVGAGLAYSWHDIRFGGYLDGGYDFNTGRPIVAGALQFDKGLTLNTYAVLRLEVDVPLTQQSSSLGAPGLHVVPVITLAWGFKF